MKGVKKRWIKSFSVYGINSDDFCISKIIFTVEWDEYYDQSYINKTKILTIDTNLINNTLIEIREAADMFEKFVKDYSLQTTWSVHLVYDLEDNEIILSQVLNELGLGKAEPIKSVGGNKSEWDFNDINELPISSKLTFWKGKVE